MKTDIPENFIFLLKSQLENWRKGLEIHQRKSNNFVQLLSKLHCSTTKTQWLSEANFIWMEMDSRMLFEFRRHGCIIIDEMTIQNDLIITKSGDTCNLVGFIDMDKTNNKYRCHVFWKEENQLGNARRSVCFSWINWIQVKKILIQ